jgi:hypothetical protein
LDQFPEALPTNVEVRLADDQARIQISSRFFWMHTGFASIDPGRRAVDVQKSPFKLY